jgi:hypothetical protein
MDRLRDKLRNLGIVLTLLLSLVGVMEEEASAQAVRFVAKEAMKAGIAYVVNYGFDWLFKEFHIPKIDNSSSPVITADSDNSPPKNYKKVIFNFSQGESSVYYIDPNFTPNPSTIKGVSLPSIIDGGWAFTATGGPIQVDFEKVTPTSTPSVNSVPSNPVTNLPNSSATPCASNSVSGVAAVPNFKFYEDHNHACLNARVEYPADWFPNTSDGTNIKITSPDARYMYALYHIPNRRNANLDDAASFWLNSLRQMYPGADRCGDRPDHTLDFSSNTWRSICLASSNLDIATYVTLHNGELYAIVLTVPPSSHESIYDSAYSTYFEDMNNHHIVLF